MAGTDEAMLDRVSGGQSIEWMLARRQARLPAEQAVRERRIWSVRMILGRTGQRAVTLFRNATASREDLLSRISRWTQRVARSMATNR